jgi:hypothetical protein
MLRRWIAGWLDRSAAEATKDALGSAAVLGRGFPPALKKRLEEDRHGQTGQTPINRAFL